MVADGEQGFKYKIYCLTYKSMYDMMFSKECLLEQAETLGRMMGDSVLSWICAGGEDKDALDMAVDRFKQGLRLRMEHEAQRLTQEEMMDAVVAEAYAAINRTRKEAEDGR